jgi:hypothetical protein
VPPLVTAGAGANQGVLGQPGTIVLFGGGQLLNDIRVGMRTRAGAWVDDCHIFGVEGSFFFLSELKQQFRSFCTVGDIIGRPFFNVDPAVNRQDAEQICFPGVVSGEIRAEACTQFLGADINARRNICCSCCSRVDLIGGFRYLYLHDCISVEESLVNLDPARGAVGEGFLVVDRFETFNNFYGGQFGLAGEYRSRAIFFDWRALVALGATTRNVSIAGSTTFLDPVPGGNPVTQPGGLLAQPSNIGSHESAGFSVVPEVNVNIGYAITPLTRVFVGYSFIYWSNVARAGDQIDLNVDARQIPTRNGPGVGTQPAFVLHTTDFWAQGINFGLQLRY